LKINGQHEELSIGIWPEIMEVRVELKGRGGMDQRFDESRTETPRPPSNQELRRMLHMQFDQLLTLNIRPCRIYVNAAQHWTDLQQILAMNKIRIDNLEITVDGIPCSDCNMKDGDKLYIGGKEQPMKMRWEPEVPQ
jgi:hypothetical protein